MRTRFEIDPKPWIKKQIREVCKEPFNCTRCRKRVVVDAKGWGSDRFFLVPTLKIALYPEGGWYFDLFCGKCGESLVATIDLWLREAEAKAV